VGPEEKFYLLADTQIQLDAVIRKAAKIGYEGNIKGALLAPTTMSNTSPDVDVALVREHPEDFTVVDIRNRNEAQTPLFDEALLIPLPELRERVGEIPADKPVLVHCAGGYRSAAGTSIIQNALLNTPVLDLSEAVTEFTPVAS
jgi:hydroxyacylglutathione hydrolase